MTFKKGDKVQLSPSAEKTLIWTHGSASVFTVDAVVADHLMVTHDWTHVGFLAAANEFLKLELDDAQFQHMMFIAHIDRIKSRRNIA